MATLRQLCTEVENDLRALTGIRQVTDPMDAIKADRTIVVYPESGTWYTQTPGMKEGLHNIAVELYVKGGDLFPNYQELLSYAEAVPNALLKSLGYDENSTQGDQFNSTVDGIADQEIRYTLEAVDIGSVRWLRCRWVMSGLKQLTNIT